MSCCETGLLLQGCGIPPLQSTRGTNSADFGNLGLDIFYLFLYLFVEFGVFEFVVFGVEDFKDLIFGDDFDVVSGDGAAFLGYFLRHSFHFHGQEFELLFQCFHFDIKLLNIV